MYGIVLQKMGDKMPDSPIIHSRYKIQLITQFSGPEFVLDLRSGSVYNLGIGATFECPNILVIN